MFNLGQKLTVEISRVFLTHFFPLHPFSTSCKHQKTVRFSGVISGYRKDSLGTNGLISFSDLSQNRVTFRNLNHYQRRKIQLEILQTNLFIIFWQLTVFQYKFDSQQVKRELISGITEYELPYELPNDLRLRTLGNKKILEKGDTANVQSSLQKRLFDNSGQKILENRYQNVLFLFYFP